MNTDTRSDKPLDYEVARDWNPELVAASTSKLCRYTGHCKFFYSVAQHMQIVAHIAGRIINRRFHQQKDKMDAAEWTSQRYERAKKFFRVMLMAHLHDSMEHKIGDIATPIKSLPEFARIRSWEHEKLLEVYKHHGIEPTLMELEIVNSADKYALSVEVMQMMDWEHPRWQTHLFMYPPDNFTGITIGRNNPGYDEQAWLDDYRELVEKLANRETYVI